MFIAYFMRAQSSHGEMTKVTNCYLELNKFVLQSCSYVLFYIYNLEKSIEQLYSLPRDT